MTERRRARQLAELERLVRWGDERRAAGLAREHLAEFADDLTRIESLAWSADGQLPPIELRQDRV